MRPLIDFAEIDLRGAFDFAIMIEEDALARYDELSRRVGNDPGGAGDVFRMMVANEAKHRDQLVARRDALPRALTPRVQVSILGDGVERPLLADDDLPRSARDAFKAALAAERRSYDFYRRLIPHVADPEARAFFQALMQEEAEHGDLLARKIAKLDGAPTVERPPQRRTAVSAPGAAEAYPDRAQLAAVLPRFDAATQAVAYGVIVDGMGPEEVAVALGVSRRTIASKLARFLTIARQHAVVAVAVAALREYAGSWLS
jgi:rubrerythrin